MDDLRLGLATASNQSASLEPSGRCNKSRPALWLRPDKSKEPTCTVAANRRTQLLACTVAAKATGQGTAADGAPSQGPTLAVASGQMYAVASGGLCTVYSRPKEQCGAPRTQHVEGRAIGVYRASVLRDAHDKSASCRQAAVATRADQHCGCDRTRAKSRPALWQQIGERNC